MWHYPQLNAAADFIENSFSRAGLHPRRDSYELRGQACHNIEAEIRGIASGDHSCRRALRFGVWFARARTTTAVASLHCWLWRGVSPEKTGTHVALRRVRERRAALFSDRGNGQFCLRRQMQGTRRSNPGMISLETIGYFSDAPNSQKYPSPGLGIFYPKVGNFIGFVGNVRSRILLRRAIAAFRKYAKIPSEGAALPSFIPGVGWSDQWSFWQSRLSRHHGHRHSAVSLSALSFCRRHPGQARLRSVCACG